MSDLSSDEVSMHGSGVCSFLCGKSCGVTRASLHYFATKSDRPFIFKDLRNALNELIEENNAKKIEDKIRVVSISMGFHDDVDELGLVDFKRELDVALETGLFVFVINKKLLEEKYYCWW